MTQENPFYQKALKSSELIEEPGIGFSTTVMDSDDDSVNAVQREAESHTIAAGWETDIPTTSTTRVKFDNFPDHFPTTSEEDEDDDNDVPLGYDPQYEPTADALTELYFKAQRRRRQIHARQNFPCPYKHCREKGLIEYEGITTVQFVKLCPEAKAPSRSTDGAVGYDLSAISRMLIQSQDRCQVAMHPDSIEWTAFWTPLGLYEWLVMPFGLKNAPAVFQRKMDVCFKGTEEFIAVYIDDILVFSPNEQAHKKHIHKMIEVCQKNGLILSPTKMKIAAVQLLQIYEHRPGDEHHPFLYDITLRPVLSSTSASMGLTDWRVWIVIIFTLEDPYQGSTLMQEEAYRDLERLSCRDVNDIIKFLNDYLHLATRSGRLFVGEESIA